jgi:hypothetical protein
VVAHQLSATQQQAEMMGLDPALASRAIALASAAAGSSSYGGGGPAGFSIFANSMGVMTVGWRAREWARPDTGVDALGRTMQEDDRLAAIEAAREGGADELPFNTDVPVERQVYQWQDKYRPRKPRYFNRINTGYDWNKYNQTHYDHDNPPPKTVQGYKFNVRRRRRGPSRERRSRACVWWWCCCRSFTRT